MDLNQTGKNKEKLNMSQEAQKPKDKLDVSLPASHQDKDVTLRQQMAAKNCPIMN